MKVSCPSCSSNLNIDDKKIPPGGARIKCPTCQTVFPVGATASGGSAVPLPGQAQAPAPSQAGVPLPGAAGASAAGASWGGGAGGGVPLPGGASAAPAYASASAVPLPGAQGGALGDDNWEQAATRAVPAYVPPPDAVPGATTGVAPPSNVRLTMGGTARVVASQQQAPTAVTPAYSPGGHAVPLPGAGLGAGEWQDEEATRVNELPVPPAAFGGGAVPLPGDSSEGLPLRPTQIRGAVPLPGASPMGRMTAPRAAAVTAPAGSVPLPGEADPNALTTPNVPATSPFGDANDGVPEASGFDVAEVPSPASAFADAAPSFGGATSSFEAPSFDAPPAPAAPAPSFNFDFSNLPSPAGAPAAPSLELDMGAPPAPPASEPAGFSFDSLPSPAGAPPPEPAIPSFADLPSPAAAAPSAAGAVGLDAASSFNFDFSEQPASPPMPDAFGGSAPAAAAPPAASGPVHLTGNFGEVDLSSGDSLEFDPSKPKADSLEADLRSPLPPPKAAGAQDGLEMLSFIDDTAKEAGASAGPAVRRFHVRRRSGKVFGPFEEAVVTKMLEDGQLLGNEEVSTDASNWSPIGTEAAFSGAIAKLMEQPAKAMATTAAPVEEKKTAQAPSMDRLKQLYEGRMAAVAVVQGKEPVPFKKRIPLIAAGALVLAVLGTGGYLGTTRYGFFALKVLFPARVKANSEEFKALNEARKGLLTDTYRSYNDAKETAEKLLRTKQYPEVRAVWCQAVFYLQRKYNTASAADVATATAELENIQLLGEKHIEVVKAQAGAALATKQPDAALVRVATAKAVAANDADLELLFLKAEALTAKGQLPQAMIELKAALEKAQKDPGAGAAARALHGLGLLHLKQKESDLAAGRFKEALAADPKHLSSAVELAAIEVNEHQQNDEALTVLEPALTDAGKKQLAPSELGRARSLKATILAAKHQSAEATAEFEAALKADPQSPYAKAGLGSIYVQHHEYKKAIPLLADASNQQPESLDTLEAYLAALTGEGRMDDALKTIKAAGARFPGEARLLLLQARVDDAVDHTNDAEAAYKKAIAADPQKTEASLGLARLYLRLHRYAEAKPPLEEALSRQPDNALVHLGLGELALAEKDHAHAEEELTKAIALNPDLPQAHLGLSRVALASNKLDVAEAEIGKALEMDQRLPDGKLQKGTVLWKLGKLDEAVKVLEVAKDEEPRSITIPVTLGAVLFDKGNLDGATANLLGALQREPGHAEANFFMAKVKNKRAEHTQAIEYMKKALDQAPRRADFHYWLGMVYLDARKGNEAVDEWKVALGIDPQYADALEAMGRIHLERNKQKEAIEFFQQALAADPKRVRMLGAIGDAHSAADQWEKAIGSYLKALDADPNLHEVYFRLAQAYTERRKYAEAITWYRKAIAADPNNSQAWQNIGWAYKEKKQKDEAIAAFQKYLEKRPDAEDKKAIEDEIFYLKQSQER